MDDFIGDFVYCDPIMVESGVCLESELGKFHIKDSNHTVGPILNEVVRWGTPKVVPRQAPNVTTTTTQPTPTPSAKPKPVPVDTSLVFDYRVDQTGFYCVVVSGINLEQGKDFDFVAIFQNVYGLLPALFYPTLPYFLTLSLVYLAFGIGWMYLSVKYWKDLLPIQHYVSGVTAFLLLEMAFNYFFYANINATGIICKLDSCSQCLVGCCDGFKCRSKQFEFLHVIDCFFGIRCS